MRLRRALFVLLFWFALFHLPDESFSECLGSVRSGVEMNINMYIGMVYDLLDLSLLFNPSWPCREADLLVFREML